jgi:hypothetical protein
MAKAMCLLALIFYCPYKTKAQLLGDFFSTSTTVSVGWNFIDDNAHAFDEILKKESYLISPFPTRIGIMKPIQGKLKFTISSGYAKMKPEYYGARFISPGHFFFVDLNCRYQINILNSRKNRMGYGANKRGGGFLDRMAISLFPISGIGYSYRKQTIFDKSSTLNFGFGLTFWLIQNKMGLTFQTLGKIGLQSPILHAGSNYINHSIYWSYVIKGKTNYSRVKRTKVIRSRLRL